jgi:hypothetical protein
VVVHERDVVAVAQLGHDPVQVSSRHPHHPVEGALQLRELPVVEHGDALVDGQRARPDRRQHDPYAAGAQLGDQRRHDVLDPAVSRRRDGEPRTRVDQHGDGHERRIPASIQEMRARATMGRTDAARQADATPGSSWCAMSRA